MKSRRFRFSQFRRSRPSDEMLRPQADYDPGEEALRGCYFPFQYLRGFLAFLARHRDMIEVLTYDDLDFRDDYDHENGYPREHKRWKKSIEDGKRSRDRVYVLIQHDVDRLPCRTDAVLREEVARGIPSNVMLFNRKIDRPMLRDQGVVEFDEYPIDFAYYKTLQERHGFVMGYHSNAYERAQFDHSLAPTIFEHDVAELRERLRIDYFSPHGGVRDSKGESNAAIEIPASLTGSIRWVHNRYTVRFDGNFSDGAINSVHRDPNARDLRQFVQSWKLGGRYRVLLHPQYYHPRFRLSSKLSRADWYLELCQAVSSDADHDPWNGVKLNV